MRPSTLYYKLVKLIYSKGFRPRRWNPFYSRVLDREARKLAGEILW